MGAKIPMKKELNFTKYLAVFSLTVLIFIIGMIIGNYFSSQKLSQISTMQEDLRTQTLGFELQYELIAQDPCLNSDYAIFTEELYTIGSRLDYMESSMGKDNLEVKKLKEYYHLLEIRHWLFLQEAEAKCSKHFDNILYFYSNAGDCPACEYQGYVLDYLHKGYPNLSIFSFDYNINNPALNILKQRFAVLETPTLIIDDTAYPGFKNREDVEALLFGNGTNSTVGLEKIS